MKIYVGNVTADSRVEDIAAKFEKFGTVVSVKIPKDSKTGKVLGCAFVEMADDAQGQAAIDGLNKCQFNGAWWTVKQAR